MAEPFTTVAATDRLGPGELVEPAVRSVMEHLGPIAGPGPLQPWNAAVQRSAWGYARAWLEARREDLAEVRAGLQRLADIPALAGRVEKVLEQWPAIHGFLLRGHGLYTWGDDLSQARRHVEIFEFLLETTGRMRTGFQKP